MGAMLKSTYYRIVLASSVFAALIGIIVSGAVGALLGFSVFFLIGTTGYMIALSVKSAEKTRGPDFKNPKNTH